MELQGRIIQRGDKGEDVRLLHSELMELGYDIPDHEREQSWFGDETRQAVYAFQNRFNPPATGVVDEATAAKINEEVDKLSNGETYTVSGKLTQSDGYPLVGMEIKVFDQRLSQSEEGLELKDLAKGKTVGGGRYSVEFTYEDLSSKKATPDLIVKAYRHDPDDPDDPKELIATSPTVFNATTAEEIDLITEQGPSEYEHVRAELETIAESSFEPANLTSKQIPYLAGKTARQATQIAQFVHSAKLSEETFSKWEGLGDIPKEEVLYSLQRQGWSGDLLSPFLLDRRQVESALQEAQQSRILKPYDDETLQTAAEEVVKLARNNAIEKALAPAPEGQHSLGDLLQVTINDKEKQKKFLELYAASEKPITDFWQALAEEENFKEDVEALQFTLQLGVLTGNNVPLVKKLNAKNYASLHDLIDLKWMDQVSVQSIPAGVPGTSNEERKKNYKRAMTWMLEDAFPTKMIAAKVRKQDHPTEQNLQVFFKNNPAFDFRSGSVNSYWQSDPCELAGIKEADRPRVKQQLQTYSRLYRVTGRHDRYNAINTLQKYGFDSALSIARMERSSFAHLLKEDLGSVKKGDSIHANASHVAATILTLFTRYGPLFNSPELPVTPRCAGAPEDLAEGLRQTIERQIPDLENLFPGYFALCDCEHCRSVLGPAAYLVDLLDYLRRTGEPVINQNGYQDFINSALGALSERRPDIEKLELSCQNSNTPLPYIDLVNEVLANGVDQSALDLQTTGTAEELSVQPEHLNTNAYDKLAGKQAVYPWNLPFNLWIEEIRTFLQHLDTPLYQLMETFRAPQVELEEEELEEEELEVPDKVTIIIAGERLGLTPMDVGLITGTEHSLNDWEYWGFKEEESEEVNWIDALGNGPTFLQHAGLSYQELCDLEETSFLGGENGLCHKFENPDNPQAVTCNPAHLKIENLDGQLLDRIHRFVRLWRRTGWSAYELDRAITVFNDNPQDLKLDVPCIVKLSHLKTLLSMLNVSLLDMLSWWSDLDTHAPPGGGQSQYHRLFLNKAILNPEDEAFELSKKGKSISEHASTVLAALEISERELTSMLASGKALDVINLENLSALNRIVTFCRAVDLDFDDYFLLTALIGHDPFTPPEPATPKPATTLQFLDKLTQIRQSGFNIAEIDYLLRRGPKEKSEFAPTAEEIASILSELRAGLQRIAAENTYEEDTANDMLASKLASILPANLLDQTVSVIKDRPLCFKMALSPQDEAKLNEEGKLEDMLPALRAQFKTHGQVLPEEIEVVKENGTIWSLNKEVNEKLEPQYWIVKRGAWLNILEKYELWREKADAGQFSLKLSWPADAPITTSDPQDIEKIKLQLSKLGIRLSAAATLKELEGFKDQWTLEDGHVVKLVIAQQDEGDLLVSFDFDTFFALYFKPFLSKPQSTETEKVDPIEILFNPTSSEFLEQEKERVEFILKPLLTYLAETQGVGHVVQTMAGSLGLDTAVMDRLLSEWVKKPGDEASAIAVCLAPDFIHSESDLTWETFPTQFNTYFLLHKIARVILHFQVALDDLPLLFIAAEEGEPWHVARLLDLNKLPVASESGEAESGTEEEDEAVADMFECWNNLVTSLVFGNKLLPGENGIYSLLEQVFESEADENGDFLKVLSDSTGWDLTDLTFLVGDQALKLIYPDPYRDVSLYPQLARQFATLRQLGLSGQTCWQCSQVYDDKQDPYEIARNVIGTVKAKYTFHQWLKVARPLRDQLREKQRAALVSYLITKKPNITDANDLYEHYLLDVEMSACMMTTRLKAAISSVQLFIQRCLMNLEETWQIQNPYQHRRWKADWEWMQNYRVWEANRKVFLYPENWIEPELRDDKTPFFRELENQLLQDDVTDATAEEALKSYLYKLDEVARLEICACYHQIEWEEEEKTGNRVVDILHVFGRTTSDPCSYYYRRQINGSWWTPWEKVDADIAGEHLIPVIFNRRLYLFWPIFIEEADENQKLEEGKRPQVKWKIQLAWSHFKNGRWSPKKIVTDPTICDDEFVIRTALAKPASYTFHAMKEKGDVVIRSYSDNDKHRLNQQFCFTNDEVVKLASATGPDKLEAQPNCKYFATLQKSREVATKLELVESSSDGDNQVVLEKCPAPYSLLTPHQYGQFTTQDTFFFQDGKRTFIVTPSGEKTESGDEVVDDLGIEPDEWADDQWWDPSVVTIEQLINSANYYYEAIQEVIYWEEVVVQEFETDPYFQEESYEAQVDPAISEQANQHGYQVLLTTAAGARVGGNGATQYVPRLRSSVIADETKTTVVKTYSFDVFYHPHVRQFIKYLNRDGVPGLLQRPLQLEGPLKFSIRHTEEQLEWLDNETAKGIQKEFTDIFKENEETLPAAANKFIRHKGQEWEISITKGQNILFLLVKNGAQIDVYKNEDELFALEYDPQSNVMKPYPVSDVDFRFSGAYAVYNWELFFHIPLLIANLLCQNQRFDEALKWYHYIFDPTDISNHSDLERFWQTKPFFKQALSDPIQDLLNLLNQGDQNILEQVAVWHENPFRPHAVARLRIAAYQKNVVMKYIDNLLAWGDQLFRRDTIESINQATLLYVLAARLLGRKPEEIASEVEIPVHSFEQLNLDAFANALVQVEEALQPSTYIPGIIKNKMGGAFALGLAMYLGCANGDCGPAAEGEVLYFCIPKNTELLSYWEKVADRLFKIRHCMNIEGIVRQLPIFEPPIDPGILVRAVAAGVDISSVLSDMHAPLPHYRFQIIVQKAIELCSDVKALGAALLSALEKRDAEAISLLRASHDVQLLNKTKEVKKKQIDETSENIASLEQSAILTTLRSDYYQDLLGLEDKPAAGSLPSIGQPKLLPKESAQLEQLKSARKSKFDAMGYEFLAKVYDVYPDITLGTSGSMATPVATAQIGGSLYAAIARATAAYYSTESERDSAMATMDGLRSGHERNAQGWSLQLALAQQEAEQIAKQIEAAKIRLAINEHELEIHELQTEHAVEVDEYLRRKFSNKELYNWMVSQTSSIFFQSYQLAYDMAKQAEKAFQYELGVTDTDFIRFGYWDSLKKGLLAGERLHYDLRRMEAAYLKQNRREYELTQHISLAQLNPIALMKFRETGSCFFDIPETVFDLNHPGHYMRRIKSVSLTIPCVTGPYTSLSCELTLQSNRIRKNTKTEPQYKWTGETNDDRFLYNVGSLQSIATSSGNNDSGLFELNFRDERYLPFEGAGVISSWHLELPGTFRQFDYDTISDVIIHVRYTARNGGADFRGKVEAKLVDCLNDQLLEVGRRGLFHLFSLRRDFSTEFNSLLKKGGPVELKIEKDRFLYPFQEEHVTIEPQEIEVLLALREGIDYESIEPIDLKFTPGNAEEKTLTFTSHMKFEQLENILKAIVDGPFALGTWRLSGAIDQEQIEDIIFVCKYKVEENAS